MMENNFGVIDVPRGEFLSWVLFSKPHFCITWILCVDTKINKPQDELIKVKK